MPCRWYNPGFAFARGGLERRLRSDAAAAQSSAQDAFGDLAASLHMVRVVVGG